MVEFTSQNRVVDYAFQGRVGKIVLGVLTMTSVVWMVDSLRILYTTAPVFFWHIAAWKPLFGSAWLVFFDPLGPVTAYQCYCLTHFNAFFAPLSVVLDSVLTLIYGAIIFRNRALSVVERSLWFLAIATTNLLLMPVAMPIYFFARLMRPSAQTHQITGTP